MVQVLNSPHTDQELQLVGTATGRAIEKISPELKGWSADRKASAMSIQNAYMDLFLSQSSRSPLFKADAASRPVGSFPISAFTLALKLCTYVRGWPPLSPRLARLARS